MIRSVLRAIVTGFDLFGLARRPSGWREAVGAPAQRAMGQALQEAGVPISAVGVVRLRALSATEASAILERADAIHEAEMRRANRHASASLLTEVVVRLALLGATLALGWVGVTRALAATPDMTFWGILGALQALLILAVASGLWARRWAPVAYEDLLGRS